MRYKIYDYADLNVSMLARMFDRREATRPASQSNWTAHNIFPDAYRRDRRKGPLLQDNGYFALSFLAEDLGKDLDRVLDTILRALGQRRS